MSLQLPGRDIWVKTTDKDGKSSTSHHRVWDVGLFLAAREKTPPRKATRSSKS